MSWDEMVNDAVLYVGIWLGIVLSLKMLLG